MSITQEVLLHVSKLNQVLVAIRLGKAESAY